MAIDASVIGVAAQPARLGNCDLCARGDVELSAVVTIGNASGAAVSFQACAFCDRAVHRIAAAAGDLVRFVAPATVVASPDASTSDILLSHSGELIFEYADPLQGPEGTLYLPRVYGAMRADGTWIGWLEFHELGGSGRLITNQETSQPNRAALEYWSSRLQLSYLEGAFRRAIRPHVVRVPVHPDNAT